MTLSTQELLEQIDSLREDLYANLEGSDWELTAETLSLSRQLDKVMNQYQRRLREAS